MATEPLRLKLYANNVTRLKLQAPSLRFHANVKYPGALVPGAGIAIDLSHGSALISLDYSLLVQIPSFDPTKKLIAIWDAVAGWNTIALSDLLNNSATTIQIATGVGDINVLPATQVLVMNRAADQNPSNIILPLSSLKSGKVKIVDFKGNASAFPHTVKVTAPDTFQGALTQWMLDGDGSSITADPISGTGYAI